MIAVFVSNNQANKGRLNNYSIYEFPDSTSQDYRSPNSVEEIVGKINLNQSTMNDLMKLPNIGESKARAIIEFREKYGNFENINELLYVPGIGKTIFEGLKDLVYV